jgi:hypothetical protein
MSLSFEAWEYHQDASVREIRQLITHRFPAAELPEALQMALRPECIKTIVTHTPG